jgi:hypothetical protein
MTKEYYNLKEILDLDINPKVKDNFKDKFKQVVYFDFNGSCKIGILSGLEVGNNILRYIIDNEGDNLYVNYDKSLTLF